MASGRDQFLHYLLQGVSIADPQAVVTADPSLARALSAAYLLADTRKGYDILAFVRDTLPLLLRQLQRSTRRERVTYQGQIRGRVDWPATTKMRLQNEVNPALYVCRPPLRQENTPQNQLLKYVLVSLENLIRDLPVELQMAELWTAVSDPPSTPFTQRLTHMTFHLRQALSHVRLHDIDVPDVISTHHLSKAQSSKNEMYGVVVGLYGQYEQIVRRHNWEALWPVMSQTLLLPDPTIPWGDTCIRLAVVGFLRTRQP
ncbi:MAG: hypothetical protein KC443_05430 [Anaerolineales bacterium]|nr:hypothetical protein [Anaerolineales bacterium]